MVCLQAQRLFFSEMKLIGTCHWSITSYFRGTRYGELDLTFNKHFVDYFLKCLTKAS